MVWWIDKYTPSPNVCRSGRLCFYQSQDPNEEDRVFPSTSIMFNFNRRKYNSHDLHSLIKSGVNIFNIDRTEHDDHFYKETISALRKSQKIPEMFPSKFYMPISVAVTMSINEPIFIDAFFSDGVILDHQRENLYSEEYCDCALRFCKKLYKPVFYMKPNILEDYYNLVDRDRRVIKIVADIVDNHVDGIAIRDSVDVEMPPRDVVRSIIRIPALPSISTALAASLAALKCDAGAIIVFTKSGISARWCAYSAPPCPIIAITKSSSRRLHLYRKVIPLFYNAPRIACWHQEWRNRVRFGTTFALKTGLFRSGAKLVVLSPAEDGIGYCNAFQIVTAPIKCDDSGIGSDFLI
ncbi:unnamed protein product [Leptosia nina]|uniref:Pyruvate kinase C-terminal domain-containing protein n=1 Tax=Leptosia nina TaxID=320188 RepID=A0AAV1JDV0_9NEOP